ncbi:MAG: methyltransferase domain-containing protein [Desulfarculus sp.]|nr:MAG: methyltransferase domain-containing protein [Desulfarculus sp.]
MNRPPETKAAPGSPGALERLEGRLALAWSPVKVAGLTLELPEPADPAAYIQERLEPAAAGGDKLPYWTKLWPAALVLAQFAAGLPVAGGEPVLELGAGLGLPGLVAAARGQTVVQTDLDPDALDFCRAAAERNGLGERVTVRALDWLAPPAELGRFGTILGAEILYHPPLYPRLVELLAGLLQPQGSAYLSHQQRPFAIAFFDLARERFELRRSQRALRASGEEPTTVFLYALRPKGGGASPDIS